MHVCLEQEARENAVRKAEAHEGQEACESLFMELGDVPVRDLPAVNRLPLSQSLLQPQESKTEEIPSNVSDKEEDVKSVDTQTEDNLFTEQEDKNPDIDE